MPTLEFLAHLCGSIAADTAGAALPVVLLTAGLTGSVVHCAPMCGPIVLGQVGDRMARLPASRLCEINRLGVAALLPYHLGRIITYSALGAIVASAGSWLAGASWIAWVRAILLLVGAGYFSLLALRHFGVVAGPRFGSASGSGMRLIGGMARSAGRLGSFPLGLVLGLLPCGLIYAALSIAAASGTAASGALGMAAFGLGTVPSLIAVGVAGYAAGGRLKSAAATITPFILVANAVLLASLSLATLLA